MMMGQWRNRAVGIGAFVNAELGRPDTIDGHCYWIVIGCVMSWSPNVRAIAVSN